MFPVVLHVDQLTKHFHLYRHPSLRLLDLLSAGRLARAERFVALDGVSFEVSRGASLGVLGANGAGKSTLLKLIAGTLYPTAGSIAVDGRVASLLELGMGFHPGFTGRRNAEMNARLLGLSGAEIAERMPRIAQFAELGPFFDRPTRTYSSGMLLRLGFAVSACIDADLILIDEALAVGDVVFQQKCLERIRELRRGGTTTVLVSHDLGAVKALCDEALLLDLGRVVDRGRPADVVEHYNELIAGRARALPGGSSAGRRYGTEEAAIESTELWDAERRPAAAVICGDEGEIRISVRFATPLVRPTVGVLIRDWLGNDVFGTNTSLCDVETGAYRAGEQAVFSFRFRFDLGPGKYTVAASVHSFDSHVHDCYDWIDRCLTFQVLPRGGARFIGVAALEASIAIERRR